MFHCGHPCLSSLSMSNCYASYYCTVYYACPIPAFLLYMFPSFNIWVSCENACPESSHAGRVGRTRRTLIGHPSSRFISRLRHMALSMDLEAHPAHQTPCPTSRAFYAGVSSGPIATAVNLTWLLGARVGSSRHAINMQL